MTHAQQHTNTRPRSRGALLAAGALAAGIAIGATMRTGAESRAIAQEGSGIVNPATQRKTMIAELRKINASLEQLKTTVNQGLNSGPVDVNVVKMPRDASSED